MACCPDESAALCDDSRIRRPRIRDDSDMKISAKTLLICLCASFSLGTVRAEYGDVVYHYCYVGKPPYSAVVYFSESFGAARGTYGVGIQNSFHSYVSARHDADASAGGQCMGPYETRGDAENALNAHVAELRRDGKDVVMTWWRYRGD
jgi:hypothetical protein